MMHARTHRASAVVRWTGQRVRRLSIPDQAPAFKAAAPLVLDFSHLAPEGVELYVGNDGPLQRNRPGNGGLRIMPYSTSEDAVLECGKLSAGMTYKHSVFNSGFSGAKLVSRCKDPAAVDKEALMDAVATALHSLEGTVFTGCDLNSSDDDMIYLSDKCPYVLASIGSSSDPNIATGYGVFGSIKGATEAEGGIAGKTFLCVGTGKVGSTVARLLVEAGGNVITSDLNPEAADIAGCTNQSHLPWASIEHDVLVPCAGSNLIGEEEARTLTSKFIIGASNVPMKTPQVFRILQERNIQFMPEAVSSAGAILSDSVEVYDRAAFFAAEPQDIYEYCANLTEAKSRELRQVAEDTGAVDWRSAIDAVTPDLTQAPCGAHFSEYLSHNRAAAAGPVSSSVSDTPFCLQQKVPLMMGSVPTLLSQTCAQPAMAAAGRGFTSRSTRRFSFGARRFSAVAAASIEDHAPHSHVPYGEDGSGFYSDNTIGCYNVIEVASDLVCGSIRDMDLSQTQTFSFADFGTADGGTSMPMLSKAIGEIRQRRADLPVHVLYEDQPVNDFKSLFMRLQGLIPGPESYFTEHPNVYVSACGTSFYQQCFPPASINLSFSATAMHWLSQKPSNIKEALHHSQSTCEMERATFAAQARQDWEANMLHRARELAPGGRMVIANFSIDDKGRYLGNTEGKQNMYGNFNRLWQDMVRPGGITHDEYLNTNFVSYYRTLEECTAPFTNPASPVFQEGLRLISAESKVVACPYHQKWITEGGDAAAHSKWFLPTMRTWSNSTFESGLDQSRPLAERKALVDRMFDMYEREIAQDPSQHAMDYVHSYIVVEKPM